MQLNQAYIRNRDDIVCLIRAEPSRVLDIGCSNGALGRNIKHIYPKSHITGIEYDPAMAEIAAKSLDHVIIADLDSPGWLAQTQSDRFDLIVCADVLEHLRQPPKTLGALKRMLEPGGTIIVSLPNIRHWSAMAQIWVLGDWPMLDSGIFDRTHLRFFTRRSALRMLGQAGLRVERLIYKHPFYDNQTGFLHGIGKAVSYVPLLKEFFTYQYIFVCHDTL